MFHFSPVHMLNMFGINLGYYNSAFSNAKFRMKIIQIKSIQYRLLYRFI